MNLKLEDNIMSQMGQNRDTKTNQSYNEITALPRHITSFLWQIYHASRSEIRAPLGSLPFS